MLSSFAYGAIISSLKFRAFRFGVEVKGVNPAFTSVIGRVMFSKRNGLSVHESAALCIGRRSLGVSEALPRHQAETTDGRGAYVTSFLPERNRNEHVWASWRRIRKKLPIVALQHSSGRVKSDLQAGESTPVVIPKGSRFLRRDSNTRTDSRTAWLSYLDPGIRHMAAETRLAR